jgi:hypothetical protein
MATQDYVARAYLVIDGAEIECSAIDNEGASNTTRINTMNRQNRTRGYVQGVPEESFTATIPIPHGGLGIDLHTMKRDKVTFGAAIEYEDGSSDVYTDAVIDRMSMKAGQAEAAEYTLECMAIEMQHLPS